MMRRDAPIRGAHRTVRRSRQCRQKLPPRSVVRVEGRSHGGQALVEFTMSALIVLLLILGVVEFSRIMLVYTTLADAARLGARYAITNSSIPGTSPPTPGVSTIEPGVEAVVKKFLAPGTVNINSVGLSIKTTFPTGTTPGNPVVVRVSYLYDRLIDALPVSITLSAQSEGIITW